MDILGQLLQGAGGADGQAPQIDVSGLASQFGLSPEQANAAVGALLPAVLGGIQKSEEGGNIGTVAEIANNMGQPQEDVANGNNILGQIFGSKDVSRQVAATASSQTGISDTIMKAMLPVVAGLVAQQVAKRMGGGVMGGLAATLVASMLGGSAAASTPQPQQDGGGGGLADILGGLAGAFGGGSGGTAQPGANPLDAILGGLTGRR